MTGVQTCALPIWERLPHGQPPLAVCRRPAGTGASFPIGPGVLQLQPVLLQDKRGEGSQEAAGHPRGWPWAQPRPAAPCDAEVPRAVRDETQGGSAPDRRLTSVT